MTFRRRALIAALLLSSCAHAVEDPLPEDLAEAAVPCPPGASARHELELSTSVYQLDYREEIDDPRLKSTEHGPQIGTSLRYRYEPPESGIFFHGGIEATASGTTYDGTTVQGVPVTASSQSFILDADVGIDGTLITLSPEQRLVGLAGVGYRLWRRGPNDYAGSYREEYSWVYFPLGIRWELTVSERLAIALETSVRFPVGGRLRAFLSDYDPRLNDETAPLESRAGYRIELPVAMRVPLGAEYQLTFVVAPFVEYQSIGRSPAFPVYGNGAIVGYAHEPNSRTYLYGARLAIRTEL